MISLLFEFRCPLLRVTTVGSPVTSLSRLGSDQPLHHADALVLEKTKCIAVCTVLLEINVFHSF